MMVGMVLMGALHYFTGLYDNHEITDQFFKLGPIDLFKKDKYLDEHAASFQFNMKANITDLFNWNTNIIFLAMVCEYEHTQYLRPTVNSTLPSI